MSTISYILIQSCRIGYICIAQKNYNPMSNHCRLYFFGNDIQYDINLVVVVCSTRTQEKWYPSNRNNDEKQVGDQKQSLKKRTENWGTGDICISSPIHRIPPPNPIHRRWGGGCCWTRGGKRKTGDLSSRCIWSSLFVIVRVLVFVCQCVCVEVAWRVKEGWWWSLGGP